MSGKQIQIAVILVAVLALAIWLAWRWSSEKLMPNPSAVARRLSAARRFISAGAALEAERSSGNASAYGSSALDSVATATEEVRRDVAKFAELLSSPEPAATSAEMALREPAMVRSVSATAQAWSRMARKAAERPQGRPAASHLARLATSLNDFINTK